MKHLIKFLILLLALPAFAQNTGPVVKDKAFFEAIKYTWTDDNEVTHESNLAQVATDPNQIIAMIREVYTNKAIPGNYKRGYAANGNFPDNTINVNVGTSGTNNTPVPKNEYSNVGYPAIGTIKREGNNYVLNQDFGWNILPNHDGEHQIIVKQINQTTRNKENIGTYAYFDQTEYKPNEEGLTMLLVEVVDGFEKGVDCSTSLYGIADYDELKSIIRKMVKSVRVVTEAKRMDKGDEKGTLFKIDCDKMNKFFLMAKGQLRLIQNSRVCNYGNATFSEAQFCPYPFYFKGSYIGGTNGSIDVFTDYNCLGPFYHMFEQFSPVNLFSSTTIDDLYQELINMTSFPVEHDCVSVPIAGTQTTTINGQTVKLGHEFMMYGWDSGAEDCQDVRDLMFFVPDKRMVKWEENGKKRDDMSYRFFTNYNPAHQPTMGLYIIRQDDITVTTNADDHYTLQLNWRTNLDNFLPSEDQEFELWQVVLDKDGNEVYEPVYYRNENGEYTDAAGTTVVGENNKVRIVLQMEAGVVKNYPYVYVETKPYSQQVTYVIRGRDAADADGNHFLSLQESNRMSFIIPGTDPNEMVLLEDATHYSRFNPQTVTNCYSNKLVMKSHNNGMKESKIDGDTRMYVTRQPQGGDAVTVATIAFDKDNRQYTVTMAEQSAQDAFPKAKDNSGYAGYHANEGTESWTKTYTVDANGYISLGDNLVIFDNFVVPVADNNHPISYTYKVETNYKGNNVMYLAQPTDYTNGEEVWYAHVWKDGVGSAWVKGVKDVNRLKFYYDSEFDKILFARVDKNASNPGDEGTVWNQTQNLDVHNGGTYAITSWHGDNNNMGVSYTAPEEALADATAHSNSFRVPVYKTGSSINGDYTKAQVDGDGGNVPSLEVENVVKFGVDVQYSSKTDILRYDAYRWSGTLESQEQGRFIVNHVAAGDVEQDVAPHGLASNQDGSYTVSMNGVNTSTVSVSPGETKKVYFEDGVPYAADASADFYDYAPIVETFTSGKNTAGNNRTDYNTYGGPMQTAYVGKFVANVVTCERSQYTWPQENPQYAYYNVYLQFDDAAVPSDEFELYKVRVWRQAPTSMLGELLPAYQYRLGEPVGDNSSFLMEEITYGPDAACHIGTSTADLGVIDYTFGEKIVHEQNPTVFKGTFGARIAEQVDGGVIPLTFIVRSYFTKKNNLPAQGTTHTTGLKADEGEGDGKYYVYEHKFTYPMKDVPISTGIIGVEFVREVVGVRYYDLMGKVVSSPRGGVFIQETTYSDGTRSTVKVLR